MITDSENSFVNGERYVAYVRTTNEKELLQQYVEAEYLRGNLPIKPNVAIPKKILDLGCGTGANLKWLLSLFRDHDVEGIDRSREQLDQIIIPNAPITNTPFEDFRKSNYDFILVSHVLQYIDTQPQEFIRKVHESLNTDGEAWFIQQTRQGMYQIIGAAKDHLENPRFKRWLTFEDYVKMVDELKLPYETYILPTSLEGIDFKNPKPMDKLRLEFMLCLDKGFDASSERLKQTLAILKKSDRIKHPNGIIKIRK